MKKYAVLLFAILAASTAVMHGTTLYWSGGGSVVGGTGTWNTTAAHFGTSTSGPFTTVWNNANTDSAIFTASGSSPGGNVTVGAGITMNGTLQWEQTPGTFPNYTFSGTSTVTFNPGSSINTIGSTSVGSFDSPYAGTITKSGTAACTFNNANGNVTKFIFSQGTAAFPAPSRLGTGANVADFLTFNGGTMNPNSITSWPLGKSITVNAAGGTIATTSSATTLTADNPITWNSGNLTFSVGAFVLSSTTSSGSGTLTLATGTTCNAAGVIPNTVVVQMNVGSSLTLNGFDQTIGSLSGLSGNVALGVKTLTIANPGGQTYSSTITGTGGGKVVKNGTGTWTIGGANSYDGGLTLGNGTLYIGANGAPGTGTLSITGGTRLASASTTSRTFTMPVDLSANITFGDPANTGGLTFGTGAFTLKGGNRTITVDTITMTISAVVGQDVAGRALTKAGAGTLALTGANTYSGATTISAGTLTLNSTSTLGNGTGTLHLSGGNLTITASRNVTTDPVPNPLDVTANSAITTTSSAATVDLNISTSTVTASAGTTLTFRNDAASGTGVFQPRFSGGFTYGQKIAVANGSFGTTVLQSFNTTSADQTFNDVISGTGSYKRAATTSGTGGNAFFNAANTWSGGTTLNDGSLGLGINSVGTPPSLASGPLGTGTLTIGSSNGKIFASGGSRTVGNAITFSSSPLVVNGANDLTLSGTVSLGASTRTLQTDNTGATELAGIVGSTGGGLTKTGSGLLKLSNADTYSGDTTISAGTLALTGSGSINSSPNIINNASLDVSGHSGGSYTLASGQTLKGNGGINGTIVVASGATVAPGTSIGTLYFTNAPTLSGTTSMEINRGAAPNADKLVVVSGGGTLAYGGTLSVANLGATLQLNDTFDLFDADAFSGAFSATNEPSVPTGLAWNNSQLGVDGTIKVVCNGTLAVVATPGANTNICSGSSVQLNASASGGSGTGYAFSWSPGTGLSSTSISNPVASPSGTTTYTVTVTDSVGCTAQSSVAVGVDVAPTISSQPANTTNCSGTTATFTVGASGSGLSYSWAKHNNGGWGSAWSTSGSGSTFRQTSTQNNFGDAACTGFSSANDINSPSGNALAMWGGFSGDEVATRDFAALSAGQDVSVDFDSGNVDDGRKVGFSLEDSSGSDILQFYFLGGQSNFKYWDTASSEQDTGIGFQRTGLRVQFILLSGGSYKLIVTTCGGSTSTFTGSYSGTISRLKLFNQNNTGGDDKNIYFNNFIVGGYVDNADNYSGDYAGQDKGDQPIPSGNGGSSYTTPTLTTADSGTQYEVVVYGCGGTVVSSAATVTVNPAATVSAGLNQTVCADSPTTTLAGSFGGGASGATWSGGAGTFNPDSTTTNATYTPSAGEIAAGTVTLTLTTDDPSGPCGAVNASMTITIDQVTATNVTFVRAPNSSLKISKTNLLAHASDRDAETLTFAGVGTDGLNLLTTNGATLLTDANWIFYTNSATPNVNDSFAYKVSYARGCVALGTVFINVLLNQSGQSTGIVVSNGVAILDFAGIPGRSYQVQRSTNLVDWVTLVTTNAPASGVFQWVDDFSDLGVPPADPPPSAYYQLRVP